MVFFFRNNKVFLFMVLLIGMVVSSVRADEIYFVNGDRISGTIVRMEEASLILHTTHSGEIRIDWAEVEGFSSDSPLTVELYDGSQYRGPVNFTGAEGFQMVEPKKLIETKPPEVPITNFSLESIAAINPIPWFRYNGDIALGGNRTAGNSETQAVNGSATVEVRFGGHRVGLSGRYNYGESTDRVTARNSRGSIHYDYFLTEKMFLNVDELFEQDSFQDLNVRSSTSVGLGYQFFDAEEHDLAIIGGMGYVHQDFKTRSTIQSPTTLWAINWGYWLIPDGVRIFLNHRGFKDFGKESTALRVNSSQGIRVKLYQHLYLNFTYDIRFNSQPLFENKKLDEAFIIGVGVGFEN